MLNDQEQMTPEQTEDYQRQRRAYLRRKKEARRQKKKLMTAIYITLIIIVAGTAALLTMVFMSTYGKPASKNVSVNTAAVAPDSNVETPSAVPEADPADFTGFYYYEEDKLERYKAYRLRRPELDDGDVVWMVNANLDQPWYEYDIPVDSYDDPYIIVNKYYKVPTDYKPADLTEADGYLMRKDTADAYLRMKKDAAAEGLEISVISGYRSVEYQGSLYNSYLQNDSQVNVDRYSARPGYSEHHTGMALDLYGSIEGLRNFVKTPEYVWVRDNCWRYGFIIRYTTENESITGYQNEPWHIRYVGTEVSADMREKHITAFEEYRVKYIDHKPEGREESTNE